MEYFNSEVERVAMENPGLLDVTEVADKNGTRVASSKLSIQDSREEEKESPMSCVLGKRRHEETDAEDPTKFKIMM